MLDKRSISCVVLGLMLSIGIWVAVPYNNFVLNNSFISDSYLPEIVVLLMFVLVLGVNPLLHRWFPAAALKPKHMALVCGMMLFASILPSNGLMRFFPHSLAFNTQQINQSPQLAPAIRDSPIPPVLFPDQIDFGHHTPVASQLVDELDPNQSIPWAAWGPVFLAWGTIIIALWTMMIGMGLMVYPQWLTVERLTFPLLRVYHAMLGSQTPDAAFPPVFTARLFWIGCASVLFIHSINGLHIFTDQSFPDFPLAWNISSILTEGVWQYTPAFLKNTRIYFLFIGLAYFMPNRYGFSIWFIVLVFGLFNMYAQMYLPTFDPVVFYDQSAGALIAMAIGVAWVGRRHHLRVMLAAVGFKSLDAQHANDALAGRLFLGGLIVMFGWFIWAGVGLLWAAIFVLLALIIMLMVSRIVAETGITYIWIIPLTASKIAGLLPSKLTTVASAFFQEAHYLLVNRASALSAAAMTVLAIGLSPHATPRAQRGMAGLGIGILLLGLIVCGAVHLDMGYHFASSLDGLNTPITGRGTELMTLDSVKNVIAGRVTGLDFPQLRVMLAGAAVSGGLLLLCARFPAWPLHPIGLLFVHSSIGIRLFMSLFIGWLIKNLLIQYGGARFYRLAMPFFLGLILGEILANALWILVPVIQILMGTDPRDIQRMVIFQYT